MRKLASMAANRNPAQPMAEDRRAAGSDLQIASAAKKTRTVDPARKDAFAARFERVVWAQLEQTIVEPF